MVWYRINVGRERNADPRWLLPLICRSGRVTKAEIGAIRIDDTDTRFQIAAEFADQFDHAVRTAKNKEGHIVRDDAGTPHRSAELNATVTAAPASAKPHAPRDPSGPAAQAFPKKNDKPGWRDKVKPKAGGWAPRHRDERASAPKGKKPSGTGHGEADTAPAAKHGKKKHRLTMQK
jgi:ATP-dependent RNA helicase DeaD